MRLLNFSKRHKNDLNSFATNKLVILKTACSLAVRLEFSVLNTVLGKLPPRKIAPSPNSNANPKPNPGPDQGAIILRDNFPDTEFIQLSCIANCKTKRLIINGLSLAFQSN